jgi:hypothetical protein
VYKASQIDASKVQSAESEVAVWDSVTIDSLEQRKHEIRWREFDGFHIRCELTVDSRLESFVIRVYF